MIFGSQSCQNASVTRALASDACFVFLLLTSNLYEKIIESELNRQDDWSDNGPFLVIMPHLAKKAFDFWADVR